MDSFVAAVAIGILVLWSLVGVLLTAVRLPGTWMILGGAVLYGWWSDWVTVGRWLLITLTACAVAGEIIELIASAILTRRVGGSRKAAIGGIIGAFLGMFFLSFLVPIPIVGTMIGALLGCFAGAMLGELAAQRAIEQSTRVGFVSAIGFAVGAMTKVAVAVGMSGLLIFSAVKSVPTINATPIVEQTTEDD